MSIIAYQPALRPALPNVYGSLDYQTERQQFERMDRMLTESKLDKTFHALAIKEQGRDLAEFTPKEQAYFAHQSALALRSNIARKLLGLSHRKFCTRLADSPLLQWFLRIGEVDSVKVFAKSASQRFEQWVSAESLRAINDKLIELSCQPPVREDAPCAFGLMTPVDCDEVFFDTTCIKANIHFPVDWVLLRDVARTLMKATLCVRRAGLKERMPQEPGEFFSQMNKLCMAMSAQRRAKEGRKARKRILRQMKTLDKRLAGHARSHRDALRERRGETSLSEGEARVIIARIDRVLEQLPTAIKQAHERIIGGRQVANEDKILSLYDDSIAIIVRGKAGAEVEFGNKFTLVENRQGLVMDYILHRDNPSDSKLVEPSIARLLDEMKLPIVKMWADRGMFSKNNEALLQARGIQSGLCPRDPKQLAEKLKELGVREGMKRRGGTEARIAIFKNVFMGNPALGKSFTARERGCGWAVLTHNLWVLARLPHAKAGKEPAPLMGLAA